MNIGNSIRNLPLDVGRLEQLANNPLLDGTEAEPLDAAAKAKMAELDSAAQEFESVFLSLMLKEMRSTLDQKDGGLFGGESSDTFGGMFDMFMGQHLADAQPLGIADAIKSHAIKSYAHNSTPR